jgi:hypothetical protein
MKISSTSPTHSGPPDTTPLVDIGMVTDERQCGDHKIDHGFFFNVDAYSP